MYVRAHPLYLYFQSHQPKAVKLYYDMLKYTSHYSLSISSFPCTSHRKCSNVLRGGISSKCVKGVKWLRPTKQLIVVEAWYAFVNATLMVEREFNKNLIKYPLRTLFLAFLKHVIRVKSHKVNNSRREIRPSFYHQPIRLVDQSFPVMSE